MEDTSRHHDQDGVFWSIFTGSREHEQVFEGTVDHILRLEKEKVRFVPFANSMDTRRRMSLPKPKRVKNVAFNFDTHHLSEYLSFCIYRSHLVSPRARAWTNFHYTISECHGDVR